MPSKPHPASRGTEPCPSEGSSLLGASGALSGGSQEERQDWIPVPLEIRTQGGTKTFALPFTGPDYHYYQGRKRMSNPKNSFPQEITGDLESAKMFLSEFDLKTTRSTQMFVINSCITLCIRALEQVTWMKGAEEAKKNEEPEED